MSDLLFYPFVRTLSILELVHSSHSQLRSYLSLIKFMFGTCIFSSLCVFCQENSALSNVLPRHQASDLAFRMSCAVRFRWLVGSYTVFGCRYGDIATGIGKIIQQYFSTRAKRIASYLFILVLCDCMLIFPLSWNSGSSVAKHVQPPSVCFPHDSLKTE